MIDDFKGFFLAVIIIAVTAVVFMAGFSAARLDATGPGIKNVLAVSCSDRGCSLLYKFPSQERRWIWIPNAALPAERQEE